MVQTVSTSVTIDLFRIDVVAKNEAFHMQLLQIASQCHGFNNPGSTTMSEIRWKRILNDLYLLECYRFILFQRPPNLYPVSTRTLYTPQSSSSPTSSTAKESDAILKRIKALLTPEGPTISFTDPSQSLSTLSALLVFSWHAMPLKSTSTSGEGVWKRSWFELGLHRWLKTSGGQIEDSTMLLFHLSSVVLHTHMAGIHGLVHSCLLNKPKHSIPESMKRWHDSDDRRIAVRQAKHLIDAAQRIVTSQTLRDPVTTSALNSQHESPHAAISVYLAVLVLWAAEVISEKTNSIIAIAALESGCNILSQSKIRITVVLLNMLRSLKEKTI
ncbi:hypothetical protein PVAG01_05635 [Phlyctema vagabunda]|uniref:Uncharacterized protein n=1 Tax=Phlyctema vagabunda TaxID=108571 RepID=A0ABR4PKM0_9HELO